MTKQPEKAWVDVIDRETREVVHSVETSPRMVETVLRGMLRNGDTDRFIFAERGPEEDAP